MAPRQRSTRPVSDIAPRRAVCRARPFARAGSSGGVTALGTADTHTQPPWLETGAALGTADTHTQPPWLEMGAATRTSMQIYVGE